MVVSRSVSDLVDYSSFRRLVVFPGGNLDPRRLRSSYNSAACSFVLPNSGLNRVSELHVAPNRNGSKPYSDQVPATQPRATTTCGRLGRASGFQRSLRNSMTQHRTSNLRATATIAFFLRVFCWPQIR